jgi:hypothetical protein
MLALKFPSHTAYILGGNRNGRRHGLLQGFDRGGSKEAVDSMDVSRYLVHVRGGKGREKDRMRG